MKLRTMLFASILVGMGNLHAGIVFTTGTSSTVAGLQPVVDAFRASIGGGTVAGANGSFGGVRREVNWDGVPDNFADPSLMPATFFINNSPRGLGLASAPGAGVSGFMVSANPGQAAAPLFESFDGAGAGNGTYNFQSFSPNRLFAPIGGTAFDAVFFTPGTGFTQPSFTLAFGVIFMDNTANTFPACASLQAFNGSQSLGFRCANPTTSGGFSFLGVTATGADVLTSVRINVGTANLGTAQDATHEVVVMDDFIYNEPGRTVLGDAPTAAPEPGTFALAPLGLLAAVMIRKKAAGWRRQS